MEPITSLPPAASIDGALDVFPIVTNNINTTQKISRNTFLSLASAPVGLTDSQTLTNKVLTSPTISGPTFSGTLIGTYTIGGTPTFPSNVVTLTGSQTLTNKVLTSPTVNSPTITNATLSADTVTGFSTSNTGTIYGIAVTAGTIGSAALASNSVVTAAINDSAVTPAKLLTGTGSSWVWTSFTPTTTGWSGTPTTAGKYIQIGKTMFVQMYISGTSNATTATVTNMPATIKNISNQDTITLYRAIDNGSAASAPGSAFFAVNGTTVNFYKDTTHGNWTASGTKTVQGCMIIYEVA